MRSVFAAFLVSAILSVLLTPVARKIGLSLGVVSTPGGRHVNHRAIPRSGGLAIVIAFITPLVALYFTESAVAQTVRLEWIRGIGLIGGGVVMAAVGFLDDTKRVRALYKLYAQLAVACLAWSTGFRIESISLPETTWLPGALQLGIFAFPTTVLWIVGIINAFNLIDGLDGLAGGIAFFAALTNLIVAYVGGGSLLVMVPMAALLGSVLGFLFFNFNPARIFMGDAGSYFIGYVLAASALMGSSQKASTAVSLLVPILAMGVPIFDTLFAMARRFLERRPLFSADRGHIHHRLLDMGITHRRAVLMLYGLSVAGTVAAISISLGRSAPAGIAILGASVAVFAVVRVTGNWQLAHVLGRQRARTRARDVERLRPLLLKLGARFHDARSEEEILEVLNKATHEAQLCFVEVLTLEYAADKGTTAVHFAHPEFGASDHPDILSARYPIGHDADAAAAVKFRWLGDQGEVSPQMEILLQLVVDILEKEFIRVESRFAPRSAASEPEPASDGARDLGGNGATPLSAE